MLSIFCGKHPARTNNTGNNPIYHDNGRSVLTFNGASSERFVTNRIPPSTKDEISVLESPFHYHIRQKEWFYVHSGRGRFYRDIGPEPFAVLSGNPGQQSTASIGPGWYHRFENASQTEDLVISIHLAPESYEDEVRFFRNFFGYLDDCKKAKVQ
jgi:mannose-6-phosphate isomerase-like protein (cupin superfamily)